MHQARSQQVRSRRGRVALAWLLALVLVGAQALGLAHRVLHADLGIAHAAPPASPAHEAWADHEAGSEQCRLLDQLAAEPAPLPALALLAAPGEPARGAAQPPARATRAAGPPYGARAPPAQA